MKLLASVLLLGLTFMSNEVSSQETKFTSSLPYYCPDKHGVHYYADMITGCRVFHMCYGSEPLHFLCPTGLIFSETTRVCDFPANVECKSSSEALSRLGLRGETIPLSSVALRSLQAAVSTSHKGQTSNHREFHNTFSTDSSNSQAESSSYSKDPSYVDEDLIEMLIRRTEELENRGELVASNVDSYVLPPASPNEFGGDNSDAVLSHIINHQVSESETIKPSTFPENGSLLKDIVKPVFMDIVSNRSTLINIKRAILSGLMELKPIVVELLKMRIAREKRYVEESSLILKKDEVPPELHGSESEMLAIEREIIQKFEEISDYFQELAEILSTDDAFRSTVIDIVARTIETEGMLDEFEELFQLPSHQIRRKRFVDLNSPIALPRELVESVKAGLEAHTKPIINDVFTATLPTILRAASNNVPLILDVVDNFKPLIKDRFPALLQHTAAVVAKYDRYRYSQPGRITFPPPAEMISDFHPYALAGLEIGGEYMRNNPHAISSLFFGNDGMLSKIFSTSYNPSFGTGQQQRSPVRSRYQSRPSVNSRRVSSRFAPIRSWDEDIFRIRNRDFE